MANKSLLSGWIRRFLLEHVVAERNLGTLKPVTGIRSPCCCRSRALVASGLSTR
jgi:hypothetical protein